MLKTRQPRFWQKEIPDDKYHEYEVRVGPYTTNISIGKGDAPPVAIIAETYRDGTEEASLDGVIQGLPSNEPGFADFASMDVTPGVPKTEGKKALGALIVSVERVLKQHGVDTIKVRTYAERARFLEQLGYVEVGRSGVAVDLDKNIAESGQMLPRVWDLHGSKRRT